MALKPVALESRLKQPPGTELVVRVELAGGAERVVWRRKAELVAQEVAAGVLDPGAVVADRGAEVSRRREVEVSRPELIREPNALDLREGIPVRDEPQPVARVVVDVVSGGQRWDAVGALGGRYEQVVGPPDLRAQGPELVRDRQPAVRDGRHGRLNRVPLQGGGRVDHPSGVHVGRVAEPHRPRDVGGERPEGTGHRNSRDRGEPRHPERPYPVAEKRIVRSARRPRRRCRPGGPGNEDRQCEQGERGDPHVPVQGRIGPIPRSGRKVASTMYQLVAVPRVMLASCGPAALERMSSMSEDALPFCTSRTYGTIWLLPGIAQAGWPPVMTAATTSSPAGIAAVGPALALVPTPCATRAWSSVPSTATFR